MDFFDSSTFSFVVLPILIFLSRIGDVTVGTLRIISVSRGHKFIAPVLGFFEVLIWVIVISKVMQHMGNIICYVAYAGGFAAGNFVGMLIEERLAIGTAVVRLMTNQLADELLDTLRSRGYGVTTIPAVGSTGPVYIVYTIVKRSDVADVVGLIERFNPKAFYSIEDVRYVSEGVFPRRKSFLGLNGLSEIFRKGK